MLFFAVLDISDDNNNDGTTVGVFDGQVKEVPFLKAPGFVSMRTTKADSGRKYYPDVSHCDALQLTIMAEEEYSGHCLSFGTNHPFSNSSFHYANG